MNGSGNDNGERETAVHAPDGNHCPHCALHAARVPPLQIPTLRQIVAEEGVQALWQGVKPRVMFHVPAAAVCWGTYESVKTLLRGEGADR